MKRIYSVLVENRSGVLCKVAGLFQDAVLILIHWQWGNRRQGSLPHDHCQQRGRADH